MHEDETGRRYTGAVLMNVGIWVSLGADFSSSVRAFRRIAD